VYRTEAAIPVMVRREGRRTTTTQANVRNECASLSITTKDGTGWWSALVLGAGATIFAVRPMPANDYGLALEFPFVVDATTNTDQPLTMVESARDLGDVVRQYGQDPAELLAHLVELSTDLLG
jgi:hypothetical protein